MTSTPGAAASPSARREAWTQAPLDELGELGELDDPSAPELAQRDPEVAVELGLQSRFELGFELQLFTKTKNRR